MSRIPVGWHSLIGTVSALAAALCSMASHAESIDAIWKTQRVIFQYDSRTTLYSCSGLAEKLSAILRRVGAKQDLTVRATACDESAGVMDLEVRFSSPVPATVENLHAVTDYDATQVLAARLRGEQLAEPDDVELFEAEWQTISFSQDRKLKLDPNECDLLRQVLKTFFSRMSVRVTRDNLRCSKFGEFHRPRLAIAALIPTPQLAAAGGSQ